MKCFSDLIFKKCLMTHWVGYFYSRQECSIGIVSAQKESEYQSFSRKKKKFVIALCNLRRDDLTKFRPSLFGIIRQGPNLWQN